MPSVYWIECIGWLYEQGDGNMKPDASCCLAIILVCASRGYIALAEKVLQNQLELYKSTKDRDFLPNPDSFKKLLMRTLHPRSKHAIEATYIWDVPLIIQWYSKILHAVYHSLGLLWRLPASLVFAIDHALPMLRNEAKTFCKWCKNSTKLDIPNVDQICVRTIVSFSVGASPPKPRHWNGQKPFFKQSCPNMRMVTTLASQMWICILPCWTLYQTRASPTRHNVVKHCSMIWNTSMPVVINR